MKYKDFQYHLLLCKIVTNCDLFKWKIMDSDKCTFCKMEPENIIHLFVTCPKTNIGYQLINKWLEKLQLPRCQSPTRFMVNNIVGNPKHVINYVAIIIKQYIYRCRCLKENVHKTGMMQAIRAVHDIEFFNSKHLNRLSQHKKYWSPVIVELREMDDHI